MYLDMMLVLLPGDSETVEVVGFRAEYPRHVGYSSDSFLIVLIRISNQASSQPRQGPPLDPHRGL